MKRSLETQLSPELTLRKNFMNTQETNERMNAQREKLLSMIDSLLEGGTDKDLLYNLNCLNKAVSAFKLLTSLLPPVPREATLNISPEIIEKIETEILHLR